jgi:hypothetical protein
LKTVFDNHTITTETIRTTTYYKILDTKGKNCITFHYYIDTDSIECIGIVGLDRCSLYTGTELLNKIEKFAKKASIKRLHLEDASRIELCDGIQIKLYYLDILCTGQSWYNKHGYKSEYHRDEIAHNREFINRSMTSVIDNDEDFMMLSNILNPDAEEPDVKGTVQEVFVQLKRYLKNKSDNCSERIEDSTTREHSSLGKNATREQSSLDPVVVKNLKFIRDLIKTIGKRYIKYDGELLDKQITTRKTKITLGKRSKSKISRRHTIGTQKRSNKNKKIKTV